VSRTCRIVYQDRNSPFNLQRLAGRPLPLLRFLPQSPVYFDRHTLTLGLAWGESFDNRLPPYDYFKAGGFLRFSGYGLDQLVGDSYTLGRLVYTYRYADLPQALGRGLYIGGSFEAGEVGNRFDPTTAGGTLFCGSLFFAADTILGPFYVAYGHANDGSASFYIMLGVQP
jgi:NTE family protein